MVAQHDVWHAAARDLGHALAPGGPLTVLLGAGASLSSGAPSYTAVNTTVATKIARRLPAAQLPDELHTVNERDMAAGLAPGFAGVSPSLGYWSLAALARDRPVTVLDLNWDPAAEDAARALGVPYLAYDIRDHAANPPALDNGLVVVHLHGPLAAPRVGRGDKPSFDAAEVAHLKARHAGGRLLVVGASLDEDHDVRDLLLQVLPEGEGVWGFFRDDNSDDALRHRGKLPGQNPVVFAAPDIDFDRLLMLLIDEALAPAWETHREEYQYLQLPELEHVVLPRREVLAPLLAARVGVLVGDASLGKTTLAHLLAHLRVVWTGLGAVRTANGAQDSLAAVAASTGASEYDVVIAENPFGEAPDTVPNPRFHEALARWSASPSAPFLLVAARLGDWEEPNPWPAGVARPSPTPEAWYDPADLRRFASHVAGPGAGLVRDVRFGALDTPGRIRDAANGLPVPADRPGTSRDRLLDDARHAVLETDPSLGLLCALVRLQDCGAGAVERATLERLAGHGADDGVHAQAMLRPFEWEGRTWLRLTSTSDRVAADRWIAVHPAAVEAVVTSAEAPSALMAGFFGWWLVHEVQRGGADADPLDVAEHAGLLLDADPSPATLALVTEAPFTSWTLAEAAHAFVRLWSEFPDEPRAALLDRMLDDSEALGAYAVLEACLYLSGAADDEIWTKVRAALWKLLNVRDAWQVSLALDGLTWRLPPSPEVLTGWARKAVALVPTGVLAVVAAYHPEGVTALGLDTVVEQRTLLPWTAEDADYAERLITWHFVHQSRARAQMSRQHWVDKGYLCRTLHPDADDRDTKAVDRLVAALVVAGRPGWALHAACFVQGALERPVGDAALHLLADAVERVEDRDVGVIATVCTYKAATEGVLGDVMRAYFARRDNRDLLIDAIVVGVTMPDGTPARPPEASFALAARDVYQRLGVRFHRLVRLGYDSLDPQLVIGEVGPELDAAATAGRITRDAARLVLNSLTESDFRPLDDAAAAFAGGVPTLGELAVRAAEDIAATE
jgi:hypothetical protein